jgi:bla regulator protein BlaR1
MTTINITQALCLTLVHSLWQGFLAAVAAGIIILCTRRSKAAVRYNLLTAVLVLFVLASAFTFFHELGSGNVPGGAVSTWVAGKDAGTEEAAVLNGIQLQVHAGVERSTDVLGEVGGFLSLHASTVVFVWMLCLLGQLVQLMGGFYQLGRLRRRRVFDPGALWQDRLQTLATGLGIRKTVDLIQSAYVSVPVTFGLLKPSILVPLGMLTNLPADQVETILLHELAHIRRNDYLANLVLHITEAVFFFNPGLRWVASLIRDEREACCDDMVLDKADRNSYFDALVAFGENAFVRQRYALALGKEKTDLLWRIRRMLNQENKKLHIMEKAILSLGLMAILAIGLISMRAAEQQADKRQADKRHTARLFAWQGTDTLPTSPNTLAKRAKAQFPSISTRVEDNGSTKQYKIDATDVEGNTFQLTKVNGAVTELVINGRSIPAQDFDQYLYIFDEIENRNHETAGEQEGEDKVALAERELDKAQERLDAANQEQVEAQQRLEEKQERQQELLEQQQEKQQEKLEQDQERKQEAAEQEAERKQEAAERKQEAAEQEAERKQEAAEQQAERQQEAYEKQQEAYAEQEESRNAADRAIHQIVSDMIELGLAESSAAVHSFKLDSNGLTLNGARQSAEAFEALRRKYIRNATEHYSYSHNGNGTTTDVKQERK